MSGIAGIVLLDDQPVAPRLIQKMTVALASRGPDATHHWVNGSVALGHCMLRTTPESLHEHQPLIDEAQRLVLVMDGRLDNREDLVRAFRTHRVGMEAGTDAELVLAAYRLWGDASPKHLLGDFAYAVWDRERRELFCVRDHMGAKPLYYVAGETFFAFASDDEALLTLPFVSNEPNEELIAHLLVPDFLSFDPRRSWLKDVLILPPAHSIATARGENRAPQRYWSLLPAEPAAYSSDAECQQAFLGVFAESVRCRMRSAGDVGAMTSGGLDSASIVAMAQRLRPELGAKAFATYSAISDSPESCEESRRIGRLTEHLGPNRHTVSVPSLRGMIGFEDLVELAWKGAHPVDNSILLPAMMCLGASRNGSRVLLHGVSGDLTMYVPPRYIGFLLQRGQWGLAWQEARAASRNHFGFQGLSPLAIFGANLWSALAPASVRRLRRRIGQRAAVGSRRVIHPDFARRLHVAERVRAQRAGVDEPTSIMDAHAALLTSPLFGPAQSLMGFEHAAGRYGVELRDPWADRRVVEFFLRLPWYQKIRDGWTKYLLRVSLGADMDPSVAWNRAKDHLGGQFVARLVHDSADLIDDSLKADFAVVEDYVDHRKLRARVLRAQGKPSGTDLQTMFDVVTLLFWLQRISRRAVCV